MELNGKVAVVTGAGRGLGLAYAGELARAGAAVVVNDVDAEAAEAAARRIAGAGGRAVAHAAAIGTSETAEALVARAVDEFGRLDVMVTNAGVLRDRVLWKMTDDDFDTVVQVHLRGTFTCARAAAVRFREQGEGGRLILIGSPAGQRGNFGQTNYSAAKAGIVGFVRTWAMELARANVTVNAIVPVAATAMTETIPALAPYVEAMREGRAMPPFARRALAFGTPEDAAGLVAFLASDAASGITGQAVGVGGDRLSLWTHPVQAVAAYRDGGWGADDVAEAWPTVFAGHEQSVGEDLPEAPEAAR
ncbi:SDR family NAD(P)-dependent oxidoreductase [Actinomadura madurae]|uniref:3-oxoacyl-[acyl-carrier protein] reductase n=1 Tax=Actinomadura madurae TaxID=1993 RepID=A0A1I5IGZ2_9ACTN|nr:SDR family NAD(P)-dependent oxidoreductase [Actinomadura madurae]SFO59835.1 3-oxoacyl-[acyl-carrier protein] reductase [Actinomadura madurae]SPT57254.1 Putative short-chain type dehydrogenase/reductase Rv0148 [Actinomadura madurae]